MHLTDDGVFVVENYNWQRPFSNFFHGIAGKFGIPTWAYYVTRGQAVCSMGVNDKNHQIMEFLSFNKATQVVGQQGFRTFVRLGNRVYEPFKKTRNEGVSQRLEVVPDELRLVEENRELGLTFKVVYYPLVGTRFPGLVRSLEIENTGDSPIQFELLDGLPKILPYGVDIHCVQVIPRHVEGMMQVVLADGIPVYRLKQSPADVEKVEGVQGGNFYLAVDEGDTGGGYLADPAPVFGDQAVYDFPWGFADFGLARLLAHPQVRVNRTPCAFAGREIALEPGTGKCLTTVVGYAGTDDEIRQAAVLLRAPGFLPEKRTENARLVASIQDNCLTVSGDAKFDRYCRHTFLDNVVRGGMPEVFQTAKGKSAFYLYSRQNGDLERDYHYFVLEPNYYSQGTGHYRSVNQNRRMDGWFFPEVEDCNLSTFMNLMQLDGYNPLEVTQLSYSVIDREGTQAWLEGAVPAGPVRSKLEALLAGSFTPGAVAMTLEDGGVPLDPKLESLLAGLVRCCDEDECGEIWEGFWVDHWHYNLDLLDTYLAVYPDRLPELLLDNRDYYFFDDPDRIQPRSAKHVLVGDRVFQYDAVIRDERKQEMIAVRTTNPRRVRTAGGAGEVYYTNLLVKWLCLAANRLATLDPHCVGTEMDSDKPGWNDSMNGLPGILGSCLGETLQLERLLRFLVDACGQLAAIGRAAPVPVYTELVELMRELSAAMQRFMEGEDPSRRFAYWDESHNAKEKYLERTIFGVDGAEEPVALAGVMAFAEAGLELLSQSLDPVGGAVIANEEGVPYTYFENRVVAFERLLNDAGEPCTTVSGHPLVRATQFEQRTLPLFLEGPMHTLRVRSEHALQVYRAVRESPIFDTKLEMYKVCESLADAPFEIGRVKAWGPGWIENESVYTHMLYKYLLAVLKAGLYDEFFTDIETMFMPYLAPETYGRSPLENVSFVVSSAFADETMHGQGLQPRLSGVTGEMVNMWTIMVAGENPYRLNDDGELTFGLRPVLAGRFFATQPVTRAVEMPDGPREVTVPTGGFLFRLGGDTLVTYLNPTGRATYGPQGSQVKRYLLEFADGSSKAVEGDLLSAKEALAIRSGRVATITAQLG